MHGATLKIVCLYGIYTNSHFWTDLNQTLHTSPPWSGRDRRVCMDPKFLTSSTFWALFWGGGYCRITGTRWLPARPFSVIPLCPWFQLVFAWRYRHYVVADGGVIRGSLISVNLAGVPQHRGNYLLADDRVIRHSVLSLFFRRVFASRHGYYVQTGDGGHPPQRYIPHSSSCFCDLQEITSLQTTVACSYSKCVALSVMCTIRWDVNGIHVSTIRNLIRREGLRNCNHTNNV